MNESFEKHRLVTRVRLLKIMRLHFISGFIFSLLVAAVFFWGYSHFSKAKAREYLQSQLDHIIPYYDSSQRNLLTFTAEIGQNALTEAHILASLIEKDPAIVSNQEELEKIRNFLKVDEINITDEKGILIAAAPDLERYVNFDMNSTEQTRAFMPALKKTDFEYVQSPRMNGAGLFIMQYVGVARRDKPGIIQIGISSDRIKYMSEVSQTGHIRSLFQIGKTGGVYISDPMDVPQSREAVFEIKKNHADVLCASLAKYHNGKIFEVWLPIQEIYHFRTMFVVTIFFSLLFFITLSFVLICRSFFVFAAKRMNVLNTVLQKKLNGNLETKQPDASSPELGDLSENINRLVSRLNAAEEKVKSISMTESVLGEVFQTLILPETHLKTDCIEIFSWLTRTVDCGHDYYDYFQISKNHFCLVIVDISGERLSGSVLTMSSKIIFRDTMLLNKDPSFALKKFNDTLCKINENKMFVSAFIAMIDLKKEKLISASAGHVPQLIRHAGHNWEYMNPQQSPPLGIQDNVVYRNFELPFHPGDRLFLYTDGLVNVRKVGGENFGTLRLREELDKHVDKTPQEALKKIYDKLLFFSESGNQADNLTMMTCDFLKNKTD